MKCITINLNAKYLLLASSLVIFSQNGHAAGEIDNAVQRQQQRDEALTKLVQPDVSVQTGLEKQMQRTSQLQYLQSNSEDICFEIKKFVLIGEDAREFTFAMRPVIQGEYNLIGRCIGVKGLNQALDLIQNKIISRGYVTTRVLLPQQNIASGEIQLQVIAGKVDQIQFAEGTSKRAQIQFAAGEIRRYFKCTRYRAGLRKL